MAGEESRYLYRGTDLGRANDEEFADGRVSPSTVPIQSIDFPETETALNYHNQALVNHQDLLTGTDTVSVTGGFTPSVSSAVKFGSQSKPPGIVLILDRTRIPEEVVPIEYDVSWFNDNPGVLAHTMSVEEGELREDGRLVGLLLNVDTKLTLTKVRGRNIEYQATKPTNVDEREAVAIADGVDISNAIEHVVVYRALQDGSIYTMRNDLTSLGPYSMRSGPNRELVSYDDATKVLSDKDVAELLYDEVAERMEYPTDALMLVGVRRFREIVWERKGVTRPNFMFTYDGTSINYDYMPTHPALQAE